MLIEARGLSVAFGARQVLSGLELTLAAGEVVGIRGENGAGKSTLIGALLGLVGFRGELRVLGCDPREPLSPEKRPGVLLSDEGLFEELSARAQLALHGRMFGLSAREACSRLEALASALGLHARLSERPRSWSSGMRRRLALARALLVPKPLYLLDEPERGLDPEGREWLQATLAGLAASGAGVLLAAHDLALLDAACDRVLVLAEGRLHESAKSRCLLRLWSAAPQALCSHLEGALWVQLAPERLECGLASVEAALALLERLPKALAHRAEVRW